MEAELQTVIAETANLRESIDKNYREIAKMAILGYNESYDKYVKTAMTAIEKSEIIEPEEKSTRIKIYQGLLDRFNAFRSALPKLWG